MSNNLIIINAHIVTPQGRTARKGEAMNVRKPANYNTMYREVAGTVQAMKSPAIKYLTPEGMYCCRDSLTLIPIWFSEDFAPTNSSGGSTATVI